MQGQAIARPRFRQDLVAEPIEDAGARFIDVMDPDSGTVFRFFEVEYSIACAMDGERDVAGIVQWAKEELGLAPSQTEVRTVIATLGDLGYLQSSDSAVTAELPAAMAPPPNAFSEGESTTIGNAPPPEQYVPTPAASPAGPAVARLALKRTPASGLPQAKQPSQPISRRDDELAPGIVVGKTVETPVPAGADFELGASGGRAPAPTAPPPPVEDVELGVSGGVATQEMAPAEVFDIPLGVSGPGSASTGVPASRDVSLDLSDQVAIGVDDVKEAVRASKVMNAVDLPKDLLEAESAAPVAPPAPVAAKPPATPPPRKSEPVIPVPAAAAAKAAEPAKPVVTPAPAAAPTAAAKPAVVAAKPAAKPAVEPPRAEASKPVAPAAPNTQRRMVLLFVLLLAVAGAFFVWHYHLLGPKPTPVSDVDTTPVVPKKPLPPPAEVEKLAATTAPAQELKPGMTGPIDMIAPDNSVVAAGAVVATIGGHERLDKAVADEQQALAKLPDEIAGFQKEQQAAANPAAVAAAQKKLKDSQDRYDAHKATLATKQAELDKYQMKAPIGGKLVAVAKVGARVTPADVVARVTPTPTLSATFKIVPSMALTSDAPVKLAKADKTTIICAATIDAGNAKVTCNGNAAADGDAVTLVGQAPPGSPLTGADAPTTDAGSGGGSAASAGSGSGSAAAGSASAAAAGSGSAGSAAAPAHAPAPAPAPVHAAPAHVEPPPATPPTTDPAPPAPATP